MIIAAISWLLLRPGLLLLLALAGRPSEEKNDTVDGTSMGLSVNTLVEARTKALYAVSKLHTSIVSDSRRRVL